MTHESHPDFSDDDLLLRLSATEDNFVERKTWADSSDWLKAVVAFANSCPIGYPGVLFIGVKNDGTAEGIKQGQNLEASQKKLTEKIKDAWPPIYFLPKILRKDGKEFLAILVPGSSERPHFAGPSYIRVGPQTKKASESQYAEMLSQRQAKSSEILKSKGTVVIVDQSVAGRSGTYEHPATVVDCNQFYVTLSSGSPPMLQSIPLHRIALSFDHLGNRLKLEVRGRGATD
jgi:hypothetical protein